jgi:hypothetical protein
MVRLNLENVNNIGRFKFLSFWMTLVGDISLILIATKTYRLCIVVNTNNYLVVCYLHVIKKQESSKSKPANLTNPNNGDVKQGHVDTPTKVSAS